MTILILILVAIVLVYLYLNEDEFGENKYIPSKCKDCRYFGRKERNFREYPYCEKNDVFIVNTNRAASRCLLWTSK